jgi:hypothetical protein
LNLVIASAYRSGMALKHGFAVVAVSLVALLLASGGGATPAHPLTLLKIGDLFDVTGTKISCGIGGAGLRSRVPMVTCGLFRPGSAQPIPGSYSFSIGDLGIAVLGPGAAHHVVYGVRTDKTTPLHDAAPPDHSTGVRVAHLHPAAEGVEVSKTSILCLAITDSQNAPSLNCSLSSPTIIKALRQPLLAFRPLTVTLTEHRIRIWRMSKTKVQRIIFSRAEPQV